MITMLSKLSPEKKKKTKKLFRAEKKKSLSLMPFSKPALPKTLKLDEEHKNESLINVDGKY